MSLLPLLLRLQEDAGRGRFLNAEHQNYRAGHPPFGHVSTAAEDVYHVSMPDWDEPSGYIVDRMRHLLED